MDFPDTLKIPIGKGLAPQAGAIVNGAPVVGSHSLSGEQGAGYVTEKLYMLLQLYLQNKGWNPSVELLQCFAELKDTPILPSASYLQTLASRVALDNQGRLVLRESGKIVLPYEHFANAVMLKHMSGPHGLHLSIEATVRAVMDSYTIGRDSFGMEKEFIVEVVQSCPSPACRYYKGQIGVGPYIDQATFANPGAHLNTEYLSHLQHQNASAMELGSANENAPKALMSQTVNMDTGHKLSDYMRGAVDPHENVSSASSELLALHNGAWNQERDGLVVSQEKIIRAFSELMRNISKMKTFIRPSMCKPYGKQSESLQKTLFDTIQLLQMLRNCLPAPHIPVVSWKSDPIISGSNSEAAMN
ncbi:hypothetical protein ZHAS_00007643 [Anopheles sinensis]|uniref:DUF3736 domain-containing protein n=1 Tax=Anopheles sinensis TaxID=74873 RepID=A0A084VQ66_ANOSI|nr:hypothetical protein ZHAS_00007643 [Anopheles sinensis]